MPPPYDTVVTIGGQSLVDGVWRLLGPALQGLTNPLPLTLPGFTNATMRIKQLVPVFPGTPADQLNLTAVVELAAEALLNVNVSAGDFTVELGTQRLNLTNLTGTINLPGQSGTLSNIEMGGSASGGTVSIGTLDLGPGTGDVTLSPNAAAQLTGGALNGTLTLPDELQLPNVPLPAVVPVAVDLTPSGPLLLNASLALSVTGITPATRFGLLFTVSRVRVDSVNLEAGLAADLTSRLQGVVTQLLRGFGVPSALVQRGVLLTTVTDLLASVPALVHDALADALRGLLAETGRLVYPPAGTGASCDVRALPTAADAELILATGGPLDGTLALQVGFKRTGTGDIQTPVQFTPAGAADCTVLVGNRLLLEILCCLVERLPAFALPTAATTSTTDVAGGMHLSCCNFTGATLDLGIASLTGGVSVCIDGMTGSRKTFTLVGAFALPNPFFNVIVNFTLPIAFDLDDVASLANLRVSGAPPAAVIVVSPTGGLLAALLGGGTLLLGPAVGVVAVVLVWAVCAVATALLSNAVNTVLRQASLLRSPVAVPPGLFEAFGRFAPVSVTVDDLTAHGVMHTPTSPWGLLPRFGASQQQPLPPVTHVPKPQQPTTTTDAQTPERNST